MKEKKKKKKAAETQTEDPVKRPSDPTDVEKHANGTAQAAVPANGDMSKRVELLTPDNIATFQLMQDSMNYTTIDVERRCR